VDRYLISATLLALIVEVLVLFADSRWIDIPYLTPPASRQSAAPVIGKIETIRQKVRHRARDAIAWETSDREDPLREFDSVLTLEQSSAFLKIDKEIGLRLDENTLVMLEPRSADKPGTGMRLRLSRGVLNARNRNAPLGVQVQDWTLDAVSGSELNVKSFENGKVDLEILTGEAKLQRGEETRTLEKGSRVNIEADKIGVVEKIVEQIQWKSPRNERVYSHEARVRKKISWDGSATALRLVGPDKSERTIELKADQREIELDLDFGSHYLTLVSGSGVSRGLEVQAWRAPIVRYFSPLPRDRVKTGAEQLFSWQAVEGVKAFRFQMSNDPDFAGRENVDRTTGTSRFSEILAEEGDFHWRVIAVDDEGFEIPAYYLNPIYSVRDPLKAPSLKRPSLRAPAKENPAEPIRRKREGAMRGRSIDRLLALFARGENALAKDEDLYEMQFDWEPVEGASHYVIEISRTADFQKPLILKETRQPGFVWREAKMGRYYWRVAAGRSKQRGLLSEVSEVDMKALMSGDTGDGNVRLRLSRTEKAEEIEPKGVPVAIATPPPPPPEPTPIAEQKPPEPAIATTVEARAPARDRKVNFEVRIGAPYMQRTFQGDSGFKGSLQGAGAVGVETMFEFEHGDHISQFGAYYQRMKWKKPADNPFQEDIADDGLQLWYELSKDRVPWKGALVAKQVGMVHKEDVETVKLDSQWAFGYEISYEAVLTERLTLSSGMQILAGEQFLSAAVIVRAVRAFGLDSGKGWRLGLDLGATEEKGSGSVRSTTLEAGLWLGHRW
jgi:hypothetical protein